MTHAERNDAIKKLIKEFTAEKTSSRKVARETLINEGIYTKTGKVSRNYGGPGKKPTPAKKPVRAKRPIPAKKSAKAA